MRSERPRASRIAGIAAAASAAVAMAACGRTPYRCGPNHDCDPANVCTPVHECARPDTTCPSGFRASDTATNPGACVPPFVFRDGGGDLDVEVPDGATLDDVTDDDSIAMFVDAAPYDGPPVHGDFRLDEYTPTGSAGSIARGVFTTDGTTSCTMQTPIMQCVLSTCPGGGLDLPTTYANLGSIHTTLAGYAQIPYSSAIGYSQMTMMAPFAHGEVVDINNDGEPRFFARLVAPGPLLLRGPARDGSLSRTLPVLTVEGDTGDETFVRIEQDLVAGTSTRVLECILTAAGGSVSLPGTALAATNFPNPTAALTVYSVRRLGIGGDRTVMLRHNANQTDSSRVDRMPVMLR